MHLLLNIKDLIELYTFCLILSFPKCLEHKCSVEIVVRNTYLNRNITKVQFEFSHRLHWFIYKYFLCCVHLFQKKILAFWENIFQFLGRKGVMYRACSNRKTPSGFSLSAANRMKIKSLISNRTITKCLSIYKKRILYLTSMFCVTILFSILWF